jgi:hypothetical protein
MPKTKRLTRTEFGARSDHALACTSRHVVPRTQAPEQLPEAGRPYLSALSITLVAVIYSNY